MQTVELLELLIPRGCAKQIAFDLHLCERQVQRWRCGEEPSPLDKAKNFQRAIYLNNPKQAALIPEFFTMNHRHLEATHKSNQISKSHGAANILKEAAEAVNALNLNMANGDTLNELVELRAAVDYAIDLLSHQFIEEAKKIK